MVGVLGVQRPGMVRENLLTESVKVWMPVVGSVVKEKVADDVEGVGVARGKGEREGVCGGVDC